MKLGLTIFLTDTTISAPDLARAAEEHGFESVFLPDHSHIPASRRTPYTAGGELPPEYWHLHDPVVALTAMAAATHQLRLGTGVLVLTERDPIILAKQLASLDHLSGGRLIVGVGPGWNREAMANHGVDPGSRLAVFRERVLAMKALWTQESAEFHGRHVAFEPVWMWPKPVQKPHPPLLVGGYGPTVLDRVRELADGWLASGLHHDTDLLRSRVAQIPGVPVTLQLATPEPAALDAYVEMGLERCTFRLAPDTPAAVIAQVRRLERRLRPWAEATGAAR